jgi:hypothetical protein
MFNKTLTTSHELHIENEVLSGTAIVSYDVHLDIYPVYVEFYFR